MKKLVFLMLLVLFALPAAAQDDTDDAWDIIQPGGETQCARDTPYQFFVRDVAESNNLMIYFQGGGACWNAVSCREGGTFDDAVNDDELDRYNGIFDFTNEANPIADYDIVFIPYCTADIHTGMSTVEFPGDITINYNGYINSATVLDWVYENYDTPDNLLIAGSSAGAYGAIYHAPYILEQYPDAQSVVFGDAGVGITPAGWDVLEMWNIFENMPPFIPELAEADPEAFTASMLYEFNSQYSPDVRFAQFTNAADEVQIMFYRFSAPGTTVEDWIDGMYEALGYLDEAENFNSYVAPGTEHTILALPDFYTIEVEGVAFVDWFTALLNDEPVENVRCVECEVSEEE